MARGRRWGAVGGLIVTGLLGGTVLLVVITGGPRIPCAFAFVLLPLALTAYLCGVAIRDLKPRPKSPPRSHGFEVIPAAGSKPKVVSPPPAVRLASGRRPPAAPGDRDQP